MKVLETTEMSNESKASRKVREKHAELEARNDYRKAVNHVIYAELEKEIEEEMLDGIFLNVDEKYQDKSNKAKSRVVRRIVEKRLAQAHHKKFGHPKNRKSHQILNYQVGQCMDNLHRKMWVA